MKRKSVVTLIFGCMLAGLLTSVAAQTERFLNAHYEINVTDGNSTNTVRSTFRLKPGESERLDLYPNVVELSVQPISETEYDLLIVVKTKKQSPSATRLSDKLRGTFGVPLELNSPGEGIQLSGAISVAML